MIEFPHLPVLLQHVLVDLLLVVPAVEGWGSSLQPRPLRRRLRLVVLPSFKSIAPSRPPPWVPRLWLGRPRAPDAEGVVAAEVDEVHSAGVAAGPGKEGAIPGVVVVGVDGVVREALHVGGP